LKVSETVWLAPGLIVPIVKGRLVVGVEPPSMVTGAANDHPGVIHGPYFEVYVVVHEAVERHHAGVGAGVKDAPVIKTLASGQGQCSVALPSERFSNLLRKKLLLKNNVNESIINTDPVDHMPLKIPLVLLVFWIRFCTNPT